MFNNLFYIFPFLLVAYAIYEKLERPIVSWTLSPYVGNIIRDSKMLKKLGKLDDLENKLNEVLSRRVTFIFQSQIALVQSSNTFYTIHLNPSRTFLVDEDILALSDKKSLHFRVYERTLNGEVVYTGYLYLEDMNSPHRFGGRKNTTEVEVLFNFPRFPLMQPMLNRKLRLEKFNRSVMDKFGLKYNMETFDWTIGVTDDFEDHVKIPVEVTYEGDLFGFSVESSDQ